MRDHSRHAPNGSVEREFAEHRDAFEVFFRESAFVRHDAERRAEIESRTGFSNFRRREIDRYAFCRKCQAGVPNGRTNALTALLNGCVPESDDRERRQSRGYVYLDSDGMPGKAPDKRRMNGFNHKKSAEREYFRATGNIIPTRKDS